MGHDISIVEGGYHSIWFDVWDVMACCGINGVLLYMGLYINAVLLVTVASASVCKGFSVPEPANLAVLWPKCLKIGISSEQVINRGLILPLLLSDIRVSF